MMRHIALLLSLAAVPVGQAASTIRLSSSKEVSTLSFFYTQGDPDPDPEFDEVWASSGDPTRPFTATSNSPWLFVTPAYGSLPVTLTIGVHPSGLTPGNYSGIVT